VIGEPDWRRLDKELDGRVCLPGDVGYLENSRSFNKRYDDARPAAVVSVASVADVRRSIIWARDQGVPLVARSSGHSYGGFSVNSGLVLDLGALNSVTADGATGLVTVAGGANSGQVHAAVRPYEMTFPLGNAPAVGVAGLVLGGGVAAISRKLGLTCDALVETTIVTADGRLLTCNARENADLFWACRGGGGGNFGVNVSFTFQAAPVPNVTTCRLLWEWRDAATVFAAVQELLLDAPAEYGMRLGASTSGADRATASGNLLVSVGGQYLGPAVDLMALLDPVLTAAPPARQEIIEQTFWDARNYLIHDTSGDRFAVRTRFGKERMSEEGLAAIIDHVACWPGSSNTDGGGIGIFQWGGATNHRAPGDTAFAHRDTAFLASMDTSWTADDSPARIAANHEWLADFHARLGDHLSDSAYLNFIDPDLDGWRAAYYGANFDRLLAVKEKYDPDNFFQFPQSIRA
jgi:FAD/FMN-containing dehydrogenase